MSYFWTLQRLQGLLEIVFMTNPWAWPVSLRRNQARGFDVDVCFVWNEWDDGVAAVIGSKIVLDADLLERSYSDRHLKDILVEKMRIKRKSLDGELRLAEAFASQFAPEPGH